MALNCEAKDLVWSDEFDGDHLDLTKWSNTPFPGPRRSAVDTLDQVTVHDGCLHIRTVTRGNKVFTGMISTQGKFEAAYGYWEVKAKFNDQQATWSDAWLYTPTVTQPLNDIDKGGMEIDIFEHRQVDEFGNFLGNKVNHTLHWNSYEYPNHHGLMRFAELQETEWHVFGLDWQKDHYDFYVDGTLTWSAKPTTAKPLFLILSTEVEDKNWAGKLLPHYDVETLTVDYVRFYR